MVKILGIMFFYEHHSPQVHLHNIIYVNCMINSWVLLLYEANASTSYTTWVCIDLKGWLAYITWRKDTIKGVMLQQAWQLLGVKMSRIFVFFFVVVLVVTVSEAPAHTKYFDKCYEEHKDDRKDYRKAYNQIEIECEVCKCTLENAIWQNTF